MADWRDIAPNWRPRVLLAEDDASMRAVMRFNLEEEGLEVVEVARGDKAIALLPVAEADPSAGGFDLVISDVKMPGADGLQVLRAAKSCRAELPVIIVTAFGTVEHAVEAIAAGAADYVTKPFARAEFKARVAHVLERVALRRENSELRAQGPSGERTIETRNGRMLELLAMVDRLAPADATVLISGESGTGKELVARRLHVGSGRSGAFVPVNCAALPEGLLESELFGHDKGAFTGAGRTHKGKFERADGGTLLLDEIGEMPLGLQARILRVLEEGVIDRVGGRERLPVQVRVVAATNRDLAAEVAEGRFRADLFHRISVIPMHLPPLRERPEDIELLVRSFLDELCDERVEISPALLTALQGAQWPGNVRELRNTVSRMALLRRTATLDLADLVASSAMGAQPAPATSALQPGALILPEMGFNLPALEREIIEKALALHDGNRSATARYLDIPRHVLLYRLARYAEGGAGAE